MNILLSTRLKRLEKTASPGGPLAELSDDELDSRLLSIDVRIEAHVGMPLADYSSSLQASLDAGQAPPEGWTKGETKLFISALRKVTTMRCAYGQ